MIGAVIKRPRRVVNEAAPPRAPERVVVKRGWKNVGAEIRGEMARYGVTPSRPQVWEDRSEEWDRVLP